MPPADREVFWEIPFAKAKTSGKHLYKKTFGYIDAEDGMLWQENEYFDEAISLTGDEIWYKEIEL